MPNRRAAVPEEGARLLPETKDKHSLSLSRRMLGVEDGRIKASFRAKACRLEIFPDRKKLLADWSSKIFLEVRLTCLSKTADYECNPSGN